VMLALDLSMEGISHSNYRSFVPYGIESGI